jgi:hypothetical protein
VRTAPTRTTVLADFAIQAVAYLIGLGVILFVDMPAGQIPPLVIGAVIALILASAIEWPLLHRLPSVLWWSWQPPRPYWIPMAVAAVLALAWIVIPKDATTPDVATYAGVVAVLIIGSLVSNVWWSSATEARPA